jgi:hypothetical protein
VKSVALYAGLLVLGLGASWMHYTSDAGPAKEGVVLIDAKKTDLERITYKGPDLEVVFEMREDDLGRHGWVTVTENKKKKKDGQDVVETKVSRFKAGSAADKLIEQMAPFMAMRSLEGVDDSKIESFGLKAPDTTVTIATRSGQTVLELGGETYGTKDRYVRDQGTGKLYVVDDEVFKPLKFASSRLPERGLTSPKPEEIESISVSQGATVVEWIQKNREDKTAAYWEREQPPTAADATAQAGAKDETFANWVEKLLKIKSTNYVQEGEAPTDTATVFEFRVKPAGKPEEVVSVMSSGENWYAKSNFTRGLVKLSKSSVEDLADEVDDVLAGKAPPEKPKPPPRPTSPDKMREMMPGQGNPAAEGGPPPHPPMMPPRPGMPAPPPPAPKK